MLALRPLLARQAGAAPPTPLGSKGLKAFLKSACAGPPPPTRPAATGGVVCNCGPMLPAPPLRPCARWVLYVDERNVALGSADSNHRAAHEQLLRKVRCCGPGRSPGCDRERGAPWPANFMPMPADTFSGPAAGLASGPPSDALLRGRA